MRAFVLIYLSLTLLVPTVGHAQLASTFSRQGLMIRVEEGVVSARAGNIGFADAGLGFVASSSPVSGLPALMPDFSPPSPPRVESVMAEAKQWVDREAPSLVERLAAYMRDYGFSSAWYTYERTIPIQAGSGASAVKLSWSLFQDHQGRASYGYPQLASADGAARVLHVRYRVKAMAPGMVGYPVDPDAGVLRWQVLDQALQPIPGSAGSFNVNGAFDPPASGTDTQQGLRCLLDVGRGGCADPGKDVRRLMSDTGALFAIIDYTYAPEPKYKWGADSYCPNGEAECFKPTTYYYFTGRELAYDFCGDIVVYRNTGEYRREVEQITNRFVVDALELAAAGPTETPLAFLQRVTEDLAVYSWPFGPDGTGVVEISLAPEQAAQFWPAAPYVVDPHAGGSLITTSDVPGEVASLPDIISTGEMSCPPVTASVSPSKHNVKTTGTFTVTPGGGKPPYTYRWQVVEDKAGGTITIESPYSQTTKISRSGPTMGPAGGIVGYVDVTVTDVRGTSATARVELEIDPDPPPLRVELDTSRATWIPSVGAYGVLGTCEVAWGNCTATTPPAPIVVSGGTGQYHVSWSHLSGAAATVNNRASPTTTFSRTASGQSLDAMYRVIVQDGRETVYRDIPVHTEHVAQCPPPPGPINLRPSYSLTGWYDASVPGEATQAAFSIYGNNSNPYRLLLGSARQGGSTKTIYNEDWLPVGQDPAQFEVRATPIVLPTPQPTDNFSIPWGEWRSLSTWASWNFTLWNYHNVTSRYWQIRLDIRYVCSQTIVASTDLTVYLYRN